MTTQKLKLIWRVSDVPTGRYRSFDTRAWPSASFESENLAVRLKAVDGQEYQGKFAKMEKLDFELKVIVAIPREDGSKSFDWKSLNKRASSIKEAKTLAHKFFSDNPQLIQ